MQAVPSLLRQISRSSHHVVKWSPSSARPRAFHQLSNPTRSAAQWRSPFVCLRCEAQAQYRFYSQETKKDREGFEGKVQEGGKVEEQASSTESSNAIHLGPPPESGAVAQPPLPGPEVMKKESKDETSQNNSSTEFNLPSSAESRRSQLAKKFSHIMDNVQGNIFIAGQRLNDLTGYSAIEALKRDIEQQGKFHYWRCC